VFACRFRPTKGFPVESKLSEWLKYIESVVKGGDSKTAVIAPPRVGTSDWITAQTYAFYNFTNDLYGYLEDSCTTKQCPHMTAGKHWEFRWADGQTIKAPISISAPDYVDSLITWTESELDDPSTFPVYQGSKTTKKFLPSVKNIFKRLMRVYAHIEFHHLNDLNVMGQMDRYEVVLKHFVRFIRAYKLVDKKSLEPLEGAVERWKIV